MSFFISPSGFVYTTADNTKNYISQNKAKYLPIVQKVLKKSISPKLLATIMEKDRQLGYLFESNDELLQLLDASLPKSVRGEIVSEFIASHSYLPNEIKNKLISLVKDFNFSTITKQPSHLNTDTTTKLEQLSNILGQDVYNNLVDRNLISISPEDLIKDVFTPDVIYKLNNNNFSKEQLSSILAGITEISPQTTAKVIASIAPIPPLPIAPITVGSRSFGAAQIDLTPQPEPTVNVDHYPETNTTSHTPPEPELPVSETVHHPGTGEPLDRDDDDGRDVEQVEQSGVERGELENGEAHRQPQRHGKTENELPKTKLKLKGSKSAVAPEADEDEEPAGLSLMPPSGQAVKITLDVPLTQTGRPLNPEVLAALGLTSRSGTKKGVATLETDVLPDINISDVDDYNTFSRKLRDLTFLNARGNNEVLIQRFRILMQALADIEEIEKSKVLGTVLSTQQQQERELGRLDGVFNHLIVIAQDIVDVMDKRGVTLVGEGAPDDGTRGFVDTFRTGLSLMPPKASGRGLALQKKGYVYRKPHEFDKDELNVYLDEIKTDTFKDILKDFYKVKTFTRGVANSAFMRKLDPTNLDPKIKVAVANDDFKDVVKDIRVLRRYVLDRKK